MIIMNNFVIKNKMNDVEVRRYIEKYIYFLFFFAVFFFKSSFKNKMVI